MRDNFGNTYESAQVAYTSNKTELTYSLDGSYQYLRGTIALLEIDKDNINFFLVEVYNENNDKIYESAKITEYNPEPIEVNCNISGLSRITICLRGSAKIGMGVDVIMLVEGFVLSKE